MIPPIIIQDHGPLVFQAALPADWQGPILPGSHPLTYQGRLGTIVIQEYRTASWRIRYTVFHFIKKLQFRWTEDYLLRLQFALQGTFVYQKQNKRFKLPQNHANAVWSPGETGLASASRNCEYRLFHTLFAPELVQQLVPGFPGTALAEEHRSSPIEKECRDAIQGMLNAPYSEETLRFYFESRVRDCLLYFVLRPGTAVRFEGVSREDLLKIRQVDALILDDVREWLHIPALAKLVHMTEFKLKSAYKAVIGIPMFERLRQARLEQARQLLIHTDEQIKNIHTMVGYKSLSGFEEAFKEKFGLTPYKYRKTYRLRS